MFVVQCKSSKIKYNQMTLKWPETNLLILEKYWLKLQMKQNKQHDRLFSFKVGTASFASTCISASLTHPLQLIKVRLQSNDGQANQQNVVPKYRGLRGAFKQIVAEQGFKGLYKGFSVSVPSAAIAASLYFALYEKRKKHLIESKKYDKQHQMYEVLQAGIESGILCSLITQPMWVIKTRMLLNTQKDFKEARGIFNTTKQIQKQHGFTGFYKGLSMNIMISFSGAVQMFIFEGSKKIYERLGIPQSGFMEQNFICGGIAKLGTVLFVYPFTTIRTRIQQNQYVIAHPNDMKYHNIIQILGKTWKLQGIRGFYKGLVPNILRGIPERGIYFYSYELLKKLLLIDKKH